MNRLRCTALLLVFGLTNGARAEVGRAVSRSTHPFTESMAAMIRRDRGVQRPEPPILINIHEHERAGKRKWLSDSQASAPLFVPAPFIESTLPVKRDEARQTLSPQTSRASFAGVSLSDEYAAFGAGLVPPDTMGAIGPDHFLEVINGAVAVYSRQGSRIALIRLTSFFTTVVGDTSYPRNGAYDPRVLYDRPTGRWFATCLEYGQPKWNANHVLLAVSRTADPTGIWDKYVFPAGLPPSEGTTYFSDYETLGVDANGLYVGVRYFRDDNTSFSRIYATRKATLVAPSPTLDTVYSTDNITDIWSTPQPPHNEDPVPAGGLAWFVGASTNAWANVNYRTLTWPASGAPTFSATSVLNTPEYADPSDAPSHGSSEPVHVGDDRILHATIRNGRLWAVRNIGCNAMGGALGADRTGAEWLEIDATAPVATLVQSGRIYDPAPSDPLHFFYPSVTVTYQGHAAISFSASNASNYIAVRTTGRLADDTPGSVQSVMELRSGLGIYDMVTSNRVRWGDYSYSSLDPRDGMTVWTIQEYATATTNRWGTWVSELLAPPPTLNNPEAVLVRGTANASIVMTGAGLFDPGVDFISRPVLTIDGGAPNGITNVRFSVAGPTEATATIDIAVDAAIGARDIVLTNPDGQTATIPGGLTIVGDGSVLVADDAAGAAGTTIQLRATLTSATDGLPIAGRTIAFYVQGSWIGAAVTAAGTGAAEIAYTVPDSIGDTTALIEARFASDGQYASSTGTATLTITPTATTLFTLDRDGVITRNIFLRAYLRRAVDNAWIVGREISFSVGGTPTGAAWTDGAGRATLEWLITSGDPIRTIEATFGGDAAYTPSAGSATLTSRTLATKMTGLNRTGRITGYTVLKAYLYTTTNIPVIDKTVQFSVAGTPVGSDATIADGRAQIGYSIPEAGGAGLRPIVAEWAGDDGYLSSSATTTLTVAPAIPYLWVLPRSVARGSSTYLRVYLRRLYDYAWQSDKQIDYWLNGTFLGSAATGPTGAAALLYTVPLDATPGSTTLECRFAGDAYLDPGTGAATLNIL